MKCFFHVPNSVGRLIFRVVVVRSIWRVVVLLSAVIDELEFSFQANFPELFGRC